MDKKMIETAKKYGTDSFEYFKAGCDIFNREELLERLFETTKEVIELQKRNEKAIETFKKAFDYRDNISVNNWEYDGGKEEYIEMLESAYNILQGSDNND